MEQPVGVGEQVESEPSIEPARESLPVASRATVVRDMPSERSGRPQAVERVIVRHSDDIGELIGALAAATLEFGDLERTETAKIEKKAGGSYTYDYETLADVIKVTREALAKQGLVVMQFPFPGSQSLILRTILFHKSNQWIYNDLACALDGFDPKSVGGGITYLSRYARKAMLGLAPNDDDAASVQPPRGDAALKSGPPKPAQRTSAKPQEPPPPDVRSAAQAAVDVRNADIQETRGEPTSTPPPTVGKIASLTERGSGLLVRLDTGLAFATRDAAMIVSLRKLHADGATIDVTVVPSAVDPARYAPTLMELTPVRKDGLPVVVRDT